MTKHQIEHICWLEVSCQRPFSLETVEEALTHLSALSPRGAIIWEVRGRDGQVTHVLGADRRYIDKITQALRAHGDIQFREVSENSRTPAGAARCLKITRPVLSLNTGLTQSVIRAGLAAMTEGKRGVEIILQVVLGRGFAPSPVPANLSDPHATWLEVIFGSVSKATAETRKTVREKAEQHGFEAAIRIGVSEERAVLRLRSLLSALKVLESAGVRIHDEVEQPEKINSAHVPWHFPIPTPSGKEKWSVSTIMSILQNEKYKGDALLQKTYTVDFLSKTVKKNNGEVPQYYIQNSHPAIIDPDTFELVQNEIKRRRPERRHLHRSSPFTAKIVCGDCGGFYGRKVWHSGSKYRSHIWRCNQKYDRETPCSTPNLREDEIKDAFVTAFNQLLGNKEQYIARFEELLPLLADTSDLEQRLDILRAQHAETMDSLRRYMEENTRQIQDQAEYNRRFSEMSMGCTKLETDIAKVQEEILSRQGRKEQIRRCLDELRQSGDILEEFDLDLWNAMVEVVTVSVGCFILGIAKAFWNHRHSRWFSFYKERFPAKGNVIKLRRLSVAEKSEETIVPPNILPQQIRTFMESQKRAAYERQGGVCPACERRFAFGEMQGDHITPWSRGGKTVPENCKMLCADCNRRKGDI